MIFSATIFTGIGLPRNALKKRGVCGMNLKKRLNTEQASNYAKY